MNGTQEQTLITIGGTRVPMSWGGTFCSLPLQGSMYVAVEREGGENPLRVLAVNNGTVLAESGVLLPKDLIVFDVTPPRDCPAMMFGGMPIRLGVFSISLYADTGKDWWFSPPIRTESFFYGSDWEQELLDEYLRRGKKNEQRKLAHTVPMNCIPGCVHPTTSTFSYN